MVVQLLREVQFPELPPVTVLPVLLQFLIILLEKPLLTDEDYIILVLLEMVLALYPNRGHLLTLVRR
jgi:hypothetical protein